MIKLNRRGQYVNYSSGRINTSRYIQGREIRGDMSQRWPGQHRNTYASTVKALAELLAILVIMVLLFWLMFSLPTL